MSINNVSQLHDCIFNYLNKYNKEQLYYIFNILPLLNKSFKNNSINFDNCIIFSIIFYIISIINKYKIPFNFDFFFSMKHNNKINIKQQDAKHINKDKNIIIYQKEYLPRLNKYNKLSSYSKILHFQYNILQYQGKQSENISDSVLNKIKEKLILNNFISIENDKIILNEKNTLKRENILLFIKDLNLTKYYDSINFIYYLITNKRVDDISHLEEKLLDDFQQFINIYNECKYNYNRKNFINNQYILYQLLKKNNHKCYKDNFSLLKSNERKIFHDNICRQIFKQLGWTFYPLF
jgi:hypothetical protein